MVRADGRKPRLRHPRNQGAILMRAPTWKGCWWDSGVVPVARSSKNDAHTSKHDNPVLYTYVERTLSCRNFHWRLLVPVAGMELCCG